MLGTETPTTRTPTLRQRLLATVEANPDITDLDELAAKADADMSPKEKEGAWFRFLRNEMRQMLGAQRRSILGGAPLRDIFDGAAGSESYRQPSVQQNCRFADSLEKRRREFLSVWVSPSGRRDDGKSLGDCTADDLDALIEGYERRIAENASWASYYRQVRAVLDADEKLRDKPTEVLAPFFGRHLQ